MNITCSSPGKVLLAGGYIVLDPQYSGLVVGLDAKGFATTTSLKSRQGLIYVRSPQFIDAEWSYKVDWSCSPIRVLQQDEDEKQSPNPFVQLALFYVLNYFFNSGEQPEEWQDLSIIIQVDNSYYHQPKLPEGLDSYPKFNFLNCKLHEVKKTGLGSSAAMITSFISSLFLSLNQICVKGPASEPQLTSFSKTIIHNLSQIAHCAAQGKVGSGFDVGAAVWGSCIYRRFDPQLIQHLLVDPTHQLASKSFSDDLRQVVSEQWSPIQPFTLPSQYRLLMGDVAGGSGTPGMVKKVQKWKTEAREVSDKLFDDLYGHVSALQELFLSATGSSVELRYHFQCIRKLLQYLTAEAKVDIEPEAQSKVLDQLETIEGVIGAGVPGAGGFDAQFCILQNKKHVIEKVTDLWNSSNIVPMQVGPTDVGLSVVNNF
ncbi:phosphomevalonate kinase [Schizosaccharomyces cryophilus OY26]|uniref:Phosphomevalonate kinase n=1 Tax=Schizosaccharomyces cryophilus (strain OY26 / ATCC MYA-4695 / CBS 11777 / NBRC 106824 / NRRL Y48691) TaxID=653667 RepID=S9VP01_SCHCR|nr:phosphomevalonate kinase [Schizosaccharomyces cryophilus OY26]EPY49713.1 phosphomevalonate kinase [Schizosaccharomyces cryophilus OY26]